MESFECSEIGKFEVITRGNVPQHGIHPLGLLSLNMSAPASQREVLWTQIKLV